MPDHTSFLTYLLAYFKDTLEHNAGIVGNFTRSLLAADTDYAIQLGDDDEARPELLEATVAALDRHPGAGMVHARIDLIGPDVALAVDAARRDACPRPCLRS